MSRLIVVELPRRRRPRRSVRSLRRGRGGGRGVRASRAVPTDILHFLARVVVTPADVPLFVCEELSGGRERSMIIVMSTMARPQQRDDHRVLRQNRYEGRGVAGPTLGSRRIDGRCRSRSSPSALSLRHRLLASPGCSEEILTRARGLPACRSKTVQPCRAFAGTVSMSDVTRRQRDRAPQAARRSYR